MDTVMKLIVAVIAVLAITSCAVRETREKVITVNGQEFLCSYTHNKLSGERDGTDMRPIRSNHNRGPLMAVTRIDPRPPDRHPTAHASSR